MNKAGGNIMIKVNAVGQTCPIPIIMTKNALKDIEEGVHTVNDEYSLFAIYGKRPSESVKYSTWGVRRQR